MLPASIILLLLTLLVAMDEINPVE